MTKTSPPRTFSVISTCTSPSLNRPISALPRGTSTHRLIADASWGFEFPAKSLISSFTAPVHCASELGGKDSNLRCRIQSPVPYQLGYRPRSPVSVPSWPCETRHPSFERCVSQPFGFVEL